MKLQRGWLLHTYSQIGRLIWGPAIAVSAVVTLLAAVYSLIVIAFFPGFMSNDSLTQYAEVTSRHFSDWHPPAMALAWSLLNALWTGPQGMLILQAAALWASISLVLAACARRASFIVVLLAIALALSPTVVNFIGVIWKDVQLACAWAAAVAIVYWHRAADREPPRLIKAVAGALVLYGGLVRWNAAVVAGPLVAYIIGPRALRIGAGKVAFLFIAAALVVVVIGKTLSMAAHAEKTAVFRALPLFDLVALSTRTKQNQLPFQLTETEFATVVGCYSPETVNPLMWWGKCSFLWPKMVDAGTDAEVAKHWLSIIGKHPLDYLKHRANHFLSFLRIRGNSSDYIWHEGIDPNPYGFRVTNPALADHLRTYVVLFKHTILFRPVTWLLISLGLLAAAKALADCAARDLVQVCSLTSVLYCLTYLPLGIAPDFRYIYPQIILATIALLVLVCGLSKGWQAK